MATQIEAAQQQIKDGKIAEGIAALKDVVNTALPDGDKEAALKARENALMPLIEVYRKQQKVQDLEALIEGAEALVSLMPQAIVSKIVRAMFDGLLEISVHLDKVTTLAKSTIVWAEKVNNISLRHRLESKLAVALFKGKHFQEALAVISKLLREIKRLDDKPLLVETFLLESRIQHSLNHLPKARAALTASRTAANAIYCPPLLQADLDVQSGILHCDEKDYGTAYSYFFEAYENYSQGRNARHLQCLKYMLLCKIMTNVSEDVQALLNGKLALKLAIPELEAVRAVATAQANSSLKQFQEAVQKYTELKEDSLIHTHLSQLYGTLLEKNLLKITEPFSQVEIAHVAELIELPALQVEKKLSQMILDKKLDGILDQGNGCLTIFDTPPADSTYSSVIHTVGQFDKVVTSLYNRATKLSV